MSSEQPSRVCVSEAFVAIVSDSAAKTDVLLSRLPLRERNSPTAPLLIRLCTKYYTADVPLQLVPLTESPDILNSRDGVCQALVLLFAEPSDWTALRSWMAYAQDAQPEVMMVVRCNDKIDEDDADDERRMAPLKDQAIDAGFEWVDFEYGKEYDSNGDKEGSARVVEALEGYYWASGNLGHDSDDAEENPEDGNGHNQESSNEIPVEEGKLKEENASSSEQTNEIIEKPSFSTDTLSQIQSTQSESETPKASSSEAKESTRNEVVDLLIGPDPTQTKKKTKKKKGKKAASAKTAEEDEIDEFENLMATMLRMREMARNSSDVDRRRIAEQFTMKLLQSMGDDEEGDN